MEDFDIYDDLDDFAENAQKPSAEVTELSEKLRNVTEQLAEAQNKHENLVNLNKTLKYNISTILATARREITRKDERICTLIKEKDSIIFRRSGPKSKFEPQTLTYKPTSDTGTQTENKNGEILSTIKSHKRSQFVQTEKQIALTSSMKMFIKPKMYPKSCQTDGTNNQFQIVRYVGQHNTVYKTETQQLPGYIEKRDQSAQTIQNIQASAVNETNNNTKTSVDDSEVIESLLTLSRGCPKTSEPQNILHDDYERLLLDRQSILDELSKEDANSIAKTWKNPGKQLKKQVKTKDQSKDEFSANLDIYDLAPVRQMDKTKPMRQYSGGRAKPNLNLKQLQELTKDSNKPGPNEIQNVIETITEVDTDEMGKVKRSETDVNPISVQVDNVKIVKTENVKQSRKQKFTDIRTNCNLEHIPMESIEKKQRPYVAKTKAKVHNPRKRRFELLFDFDETVDEVVTKRGLRMKTPSVDEILTKVSETSTELHSTSNTNDSQLMSECTEELKFQPIPPGEAPLSNPTTILSEELPVLPAFDFDNQIKSIIDPVQPQLPPSVELSSLFPNLSNSQIKLCSNPDPPLPSPPPTPAPMKLPPLPSDDNIEYNNTEALIFNKTFGSQGGDQDNHNASINSSVEIKMSTTSYKIETLGDETTVYIRRNKKKKKHSL